MTEAGTCIPTFHQPVITSVQNPWNELWLKPGRAYPNPQDGRDFLGIDEWKPAEAVQAFSANPQIQEFFAQMFEGQPEITIWEGSGWNEW